MLRDASKTNSGVGSATLSTDYSHSVSVLLSFVDANIVGFRNYYLIGFESLDENFITFHLVNYFNACLGNISNGYAPYRFSFIKNPPQIDSRKETDLGVVILNPSEPAMPIVEFEAKRLSQSANNSEYVHGERGGIERFKRGHHAAHLNVCGMFGYVQDKTISHWLGKINGWISDLGVNNTDTSIDWKPDEEKLIPIQECDIDKYQSSNLRSKQPIVKLYHYFINLVN
jgi:hypothetical protein